MVFQDELELVVFDYLRPVSLTLMLHDYFLTLDIEVKCLWQRRATRSSYIFFVHRYLNLCTTVLSFMSTFMSSLPFSCYSALILREALVIFTQLTVSGILTLRIYALYGCNRRLLCFMLSVGVAMIILACVRSTPGATSVARSPSSRHQFLVFSSHKDQLVEQLTLGVRCNIYLDRITSFREGSTWVMVFIYDTMIFGLSVWIAFKTRREFEMLRRITVSLKVILLRDGVIYFGIVSVVNLANILTFYASFADGAMRGGLAPFACSLEATLVSRLMLKLHEGMDSIGIYATSYASQISSQVYFEEQNP
ncbi:hypothetical protein L218DRAFT_1078124 [Marasmius fiardii PR-910]|nr:hypothetical protein L218DRAFT_1078124 [Marasmius fiardii PR-910]